MSNVKGEDSEDGYEEDEFANSNSNSSPKPSGRNQTNGSGGQQPNSMPTGSSAKGETESLQQADDEDLFVGTFNFNSSGEALQGKNHEGSMGENVSRNLGDLIRVPGIVKVLSPSVLNKIAKDPLFSVNVAQNVTEEVKVLVQTVLADQEDEDYGYFEDFNYDVDYDYDTAEAAVGNILDGLDPGLLASISPDLLIAYFESATVDDVKSILKDSTILLSLSPKTVVELLKKLPEETVTTISPFYLNTISESKQTKYLREEK